MSPTQAAYRTNKWPILGAILLSLFALTRFNSYQATQRDLAYIEELPGKAWCNNTDQVFNGLEYVNDGGWPCIKLTDVVNVREVGNDYCAMVTLGVEAGPPGEAVYRETGLDYCSPRKYEGGGFEDGLFFDYISAQLTQVNAELCARYRTQIGEDRWFKLC